ncbi:unnamed protein product [Rangifer tarandus platyrhynchus]|uniref:Uncharacterized protein n=1 Tax=Rangifer tarandus platyrhynchus TaxID=3082113 RepID=A0ABN9A7N7_RANTA|nr:unnamed protein product [Rangifer tarandus platyrhynchus]
MRAPPSDWQPGTAHARPPGNARASPRQRPRLPGCARRAGRSRLGARTRTAGGAGSLGERGRAREGGGGDSERRGRAREGEEARLGDLAEDPDVEALVQPRSKVSTVRPRRPRASLCRNSCLPPSCLAFLTTLFLSVNTSGPREKLPFLCDHRSVDVASYVCTLVLLALCAGPGEGPLLLP